MSVNILTKEDLVLFQDELLTQIKGLLNQSPVQTKKWLKTDEVKDLLKVSASTLQTLRINGTLTYSKLGGIIYYDYEHIENVLKKNLRYATKTWFYCHSECSKESDQYISKSPNHLTMFSPYRGRSHTKKQNSCKPCISIAERKKRSACKKLKRLFPNLAFQLYQHHITDKSPLVGSGSWARRSWITSGIWMHFSHL